MDPKQKSEIERFLDAVDRADKGDETAFDGVTLVLDGEPGEEYDDQD